MRKISSVIAIALLICLTGVSCRGELATADCNLVLSGKGLETSGVTYQYSVIKINRGGTSLVRDWTEFSDLHNLVIENLARGNYTFRVRGISSESKVTMYEGSTTCYLSSSDHGVIEIVLSNQIDLSKESTLKIQLLNSHVSDCTASVVLTEKRTGQVQTKDINPNASGFSSTYNLTPGYYDISAFVYQEGIEVGGIFTSVFVPNGYEKSLDLNIEIQKIPGTIFNISENEKITVDVGAAASLAWPCRGGSGNFGQWIMDGKVLESNAFHYEIPTADYSEYTVEYHRGGSVYSCDVTVGGKKTKINILNFRGADGYTACVGYKDKNGNLIPVEGKEVPGEGDIFDYEDFGLEPVLVSTIGTNGFAEIYDITDFNTSIYGSNIKAKNSTLKVLVTGGNILSEAMSKLSALETVVLREPSRIESYAFYDVTGLKTVYIFPATGKTSIQEDAFDSCSNLERVCVIGTADQMVYKSGCFNGTKVTKDKVEYITAIP